MAKVLQELIGACEKGGRGKPCPIVNALAMGHSTSHK